MKIEKCSYNYSPEIKGSNRIDEVKLAFEFLGKDAPDNKENLIIEAFEFEQKKLTVIYGISGSGKSTLLKHFYRKGDSLYLTDIEIESNKAIIDLIGDNLAEAIQLLTYCGLGEGNLFLRTVEELSEGQKFRLKIALAIYYAKSKGQFTLLIDEFGGVLDTGTAKGLASSISKICQQDNNLNIVICCNNLDICESFIYDTLIKLSLDSTVEVKYNENKKYGQTTDISNLRVLKGNIEEYQEFKKYHYLDIDYSREDLRIYLAYINDKVVGCVILSSPIRSSVVSKNKHFEEINRSIATIHRLVVHPEYRGQGITTEIVEQVQKIEGNRVLNILSSLFYYVPVPEKWGFINSDDIFDSYYNRIRLANNKISKYIQEKGYNVVSLKNNVLYQDFISQLNMTDLEYLKDLAMKDAIERAKSLIFYYVELFTRAGYYVSDSFDKILADFISDFDNEISDLELEVIIKSNVQPRYASYYKIFD